MVQKRVDRMASELQLSDAQVELLNKLFLDDMAYRRENFKRPEGPKPEFKGGDHKKREFTEEDKARFEKMKEYSLQQEEKLKSGASPIPRAIGTIITVIEARLSTAGDVTVTSRI